MGTSTGLPEFDDWRMSGLASRSAGLDSVQLLEGAHLHVQAIDCYSYLYCLDGLPGFWKRPQPQPVKLASLKACRRSHLSFDRDGQVSELLIQEGQRVEAIVHFSRESGM